MGESNNRQDVAQTASVVPVISMDVLRGKHYQSPGSEIGEGYHHWRRMIYVVLGRWPFFAAPGQRAFQSIPVATRYADLLAAYLMQQGYEVRVGDAYSEDTRMLKFWRRTSLDTLRAMLLPPARLEAMERVDARAEE